jgi:excinuclease ABC subunit C
MPTPISIPKLKDRLAQIPSEPGVYLFKDAESTIIYVGKAAQLNKRLASYFSEKRHTDAKLNALLQRIEDFEFILVGSEKEALVLESNLIKKHRPRYNVVLKDDKRYPCLRINTRHSYPKLSIVRKIKKDGNLYFGPFTSTGAVRQSLKIVNKTFKLRKCSNREFKQRARPCLHYQMKQCLAPCCKNVDPKVYQAMIQEVVLFLNGRTPDLVKQIRSEMIQRANKQEFEKAAELRDKLRALEKTLEKQRSVSTDMKDRDVIGIWAEAGNVMITMLYIRGGFLLGKQQFPFENIWDSASEILRGFMRQFYEGTHSIPPEILVSHLPDDVNIIKSALAHSRGSSIIIHQPQKGEKRKLVQMALENAEIGLSEWQAANALDMALLQGLKQKLKMDRLPQHIECFDNSHLYGSDAVSAMVVFEMAHPKKSAYRSYRLKTPVMQDDYAAMAEVLGRRFGHSDKRDPLPDLLVVDGGKGQLNIAADIIAALGLKGLFEIVGIAKKDESKGEDRDKIYQLGRVNAVAFGRHLQELFLLQRIRDEAHRFAIRYHRKRRGKSGLHSVLDDIPGVGPKRRNLLLSHFGGIESIRSADVSLLAALPGMNQKVARSIKAVLSESQDGE